MKHFCIVLLFLLPFNLNAQLYLKALYANDIAQAQALLANETVNMNSLLILYLTGTSSLSSGTVKWLLDHGAKLDFLIKDISNPKSIFQMSDVEPTVALLRIVKEGNYAIIDLLANTAVADGVGYNFYFGSYRSQSVGSNGLLGAMLSKNFTATNAMIEYVWQKASVYYKGGALISSNLPVVIALTDNVTDLQAAIASGISPEHFWQPFIDFKAQKGLKYLISINARQLFNFNGQLVSPLDYAKEKELPDTVSLLSTSPTRP